MARDLAATLKGTVDETFSGILSNAAEDSAWLANPAFAALVSGSALRTADVAAGRITVFLQIPMDVMLNTPGLARVLVGAFLNAAYQSDGRVNGRILFLLDEAARLGPMSVLKQARDAGRKYGITLALYLQSTGQLLDTWGRDGAREWYDGVSWRAYAAIADLDTAREISAMVGKYGVLATSEGVNRGLSRRFTEAGSRSRGSNQSFHEISRDLVRPEELISDMRVDDQIVIPRGGRPLRCGRAIYFRRPEFAARVQANRFASRRAA
jgi:type IV secretion system protein VirD4